MDSGAATDWHYHATRGNKEERFTPIEVKAKGRAIPLHNVKSSSKILRRAHQRAIIKIPGIQCESRKLGLDLLDERMECQGKTEWAQRIPLLHTTATVDRVLTQEEEWLTRIAGLHPGRNGGRVAMGLHKHGLP